MKLVEIPGFLNDNTVKQIVDIISGHTKIKQGLAWGFAGNVNDGEIESFANVPGIVLDLTRDLIDYHMMTKPIPDMIVNPLYELTNQLVFDMVKKSLEFDITMTELHRLRYNILFGSLVEGPHLPHVDDSVLCEDGREHWVGILHLHGDGPTYIFDKKWSGEKDTDMSGVDYKIIDFEPGKLTIFDGNYYHASTSPKNNNWRLVINMNLS